MNPLEFMKNFRGKNPEEIVLKELKNQINNPIISNLIDMKRKGQDEKINEFARNLCKQKGLDFDEISRFLNGLNMK